MAGHSLLLSCVSLRTVKRPVNACTSSGSRVCRVPQQARLYIRNTAGGVRTRRCSCLRSSACLSITTLRRSA